MHLPSRASTTCARQARTFHSTQPATICAALHPVEINVVSSTKPTGSYCVKVWGAYAMCACYCVWMHSHADLGICKSQTHPSYTGSPHKTCPSLYVCTTEDSDTGNAQSQQGAVQA